MRNVKVRNLINYNGNMIANQFDISVDNTVLFQSYTSIVAHYDRGSQVLTLGLDWDYSITTLKHLYKWIQDNAYHVWGLMDGKGSMKSQLQRLMDSGIVKYDRGMI